jgi:hypothetical protein
MTAPGTAASRRTPILIGVVAVLILGFLAFKLLGGSDDAPPIENSPPLASGTTVPRAGSTTTTTRPSETFEVFNTKNPFLPLRGSGAGSSGSGTTTGGTTTGGTGTSTGGTGTGGTTATTTSTGGTGTGTGTGTGGTTATTTGASGGGTAPSRGERVTLLDVFTEAGVLKANVKVNDTVYKVAAGEEFATNYKVVSLSASTECGRFLFGDDQFRLCRGEQVVK